MSRTYTTTGIILKRRDYQEHDRLFCLYTKDYGKIDVLAKGTKKITSKLNGYMEPFYLVKLMIAKGKGFDKLANCDLLKSYQNLRHNIFGFYLLNYIAEITDGLIAGHTEKQDKYDLLINLLDILDAQIEFERKENLLLLVNIYNLKLLKFLGYQPEIKRCLYCHKGILLPKNIFDFRQGGIICEECKKVCLIEDYIYVSDQTIKLLQLAEINGFEQFLDIQTNQEELKQFNKLVFKLLLVNLERPIKTLDFFKSIC